MAGFMHDFQEFINKGDIMDLAVGIIIGSAFTSIVASLVKDIFMPVIGMLTGGLDFAGLSITVGSATLTYGNFINAVVQFLFVALIVFLLVRTMANARLRVDAARGVTLAKAPHCPYCMEEVKPGATRCSHCGAEFDSPAEATVEAVAAPTTAFDNVVKKATAKH